MNKYYLRIDNDKFGFVVDGIHEIKDTDIEITNSDYDMFFEKQGQGKQFRIKNVSGKNLFDIVEEYVPPVDTTPQPPSDNERISALEEAMLLLL